MMNVMDWRPVVIRQSIGGYIDIPNVLWSWSHVDLLRKDLGPHHSYTFVAAGDVQTPTHRAK